MKKYALSAKNKGQRIELSTETKRAEIINLDPLSFYYRKHLKSLLKAGYEVEKDFDHKMLKTVKSKDGEILYRRYYGSIKLRLKK